MQDEFWEVTQGIVNLVFTFKNVTGCYEGRGWWWDREETGIEKDKKQTE